MNCITAAQIKELCIKANKALVKGGYQDGKDVIDSVFVSNDTSYKNIILRLRLIDSFYSTGLTNRQYGFEELAQAISSDKGLQGRLKDFANGNTDDISPLFTARFGLRAGFNSREKVAIRATSLVSKYAYFLTKHDFPIYDSLVPKGYNIIIKRLRQAETLQKITVDKANKTSLTVDADIKKYFQAIRALKVVLNHEEPAISYENLDQLFWLWGKVENKSYSLIVDSGMYQLINGAPVGFVKKEGPAALRAFINALLDLGLIKEGGKV